MSQNYFFVIGFISNRPFGLYDAQVERVLWESCQHAHILISHDYKIDQSERVMEKSHSNFDQLFREVINFVELVLFYSNYLFVYVLID